MHQQMGKLYVVATPIGNLDDVSVRANKILSQVNWIAAEDTRHSLGLLQHLGISTPLVSYHEHNEQQRTKELIEKLCQGENGALISDAGTPLISDPGYILVAAAHEVGIQVVPVPGPCAFVTALSAAGLATDKFLFEGFLPSKGQVRRKQLEPLAHFPHTMIFYEAPHRIALLLEECAEVFTPQRSATLVRELTKKFESIYKSNFHDLIAEVANGNIPLKGEFILIVAGESAPKHSLTKDEGEMERILSVLLPEMPLKQAVQITVKLTGLPKNAVYEWATKMKRD